MKVSIERCVSYEPKRVREALEKSLENINFEFKKNIKVLIKPNLLTPNHPNKAITTHPTILGELCKILKKKGAKIYIGESSAYDTDLAFKECGLLKLKKYAKLINFEAEDKKFFDFKHLKRVPLAKILFQVDLIINAAKLKTHGLTKATLSVKNLYGCIPGRLKENYHKNLRSPKDFSKFLLDLHKKIKPGLNIIDGVIGIEGEGPGASGKVIKSKVILAGKDARAVDIIASELMGFRWKSIFTNKFSGVKKDEIEVLGNGKNIKLNFKKPGTAAVPLFLSVINFLPKPKITFDKKKCVKCGLCSRKCPAKAINLNPWPDCNHKICIKCLCCIEVCPHKAISLKEHWSRRAIMYIVRKLRGV